MRKLALALVAGSMMVPAALPSMAAAQTWRSINSRQANQFTRINLGVRNGALTQAEATRLRNQFYALARLERRYKANGLSTREKAELNRQFDALSRRIYTQKHDRQGR